MISVTTWVAIYRANIGDQSPLPMWEWEQKRMIINERTRRLPTEAPGFRIRPAWASSIASVRWPGFGAFSQNVGAKLQDETGFNFREKYQTQSIAAFAFLANLYALMRTLGLELGMCACEIGSIRNIWLRGDHPSRLAQEREAAASHSWILDVSIGVVCFELHRKFSFIFGESSLAPMALCTNGSLSRRIDILFTLTSKEDRSSYLSIHHFSDSTVCRVLTAVITSTYTVIREKFQILLSFTL